MTDDLASIIIPCFNKERYVSDAINSALSQTHTNCEVIVIDDGSTDESLAEIQKYEGRIALIEGSNRGASAARNTGLSIARGKWIQFLDADDILSPQKIELQIKSLKESPRLSIANCRWRYFSTSSESMTAKERSYWCDRESGFQLLLEMWLTGGFFPNHSWLVPSDLISLAGNWDTSLTVDDDGEYFGKLLTHAGQVVHTSETLCHYRVPEKGGVSRSQSLSASESALRSWQSVTAEILKTDNSSQSIKACRRRLELVAYSQLSNYPSLMQTACDWEKNHRTWDPNPTLPPITRWLVAIAGIETGIKLRSLAGRIG